MVEIIKQFGELVKSLDLKGVLPLSNGLAAIALILAALLVLIALVRRKTTFANFVLVVFFCITAGAFVALDTFRPAPTDPAILHLMAGEVDAGVDAFPPLHVSLNGEDEWDVFSVKGKDEKLPAGKSVLFINASIVASRLMKQSIATSALTQQLEQLQRGGAPPIDAMAAP